MPVTKHGYALKDPHGFLLHEWFHKSKEYIMESLEGNYSKLQAEKMLRLGYKIVPATQVVSMTRVKISKDRLCLGCRCPMSRKSKAFFCIECVDLWRQPSPKRKVIWCGRDPGEDALKAASKKVKKRWSL